MNSDIVYHPPYAPERSGIPACMADDIEESVRGEDYLFPDHHHPRSFSCRNHHHHHHHHSSSCLVETRPQRAKWRHAIPDSSVEEHLPAYDSCAEAADIISPASDADISRRTSFSDRHGKQSSQSLFSRLWSRFQRPPAEEGFVESEAYSSGEFGQSTDSYDLLVNEVDERYADVEGGREKGTRGGFSCRRQTPKDIASAKQEETTWLLQSQDHGVVAPWEVHPVKRKMRQLLSFGWTTVQCLVCCRCPWFEQ